MTGWQALTAERRMLYSPVGLRLIDDFSGQSPIGRVRCVLERARAPGDWVATGIEAVRTPGDVIVFPGLGRSASAALQAPTRYRVRIEADHYRGDYQTTAAGVEFDAHPYDDSNPPAMFAKVAQPVFLLPAPSYPFPAHVRVLRGVLHDGGGEPVGLAEVTAGSAERVLSDERGGFALPLRWAALGGQVAIDATDHRTGATGQISITLPGALASGQMIVLT